MQMLVMSKSTTEVRDSLTIFPTRDPCYPMEAHAWLYSCAEEYPQET